MNERLKRLCQEVYLKSVVPNVNFAQEFIELAPSINEAISDFNGLKTDVYPSLKAKSLADLKVALVMSDFTSVFIKDGGSMELFGSHEPTRALPKVVALPPEVLEQLEHREGKPIVGAGYFRSVGKEIDDFLRQVEALAQSGRLMIRPVPIVIGFEKEPHDDGGKVMRAMPVEPNSPADAWFSTGTTHMPDSLALKEGETDPRLESEIGSFMIPYLDGLSFERLSAILDDEEDALAGFRSSVRTMLAEVRGDPSKSNDILNDIVRPATEKVGRRFNSIAAIHGFKVAGVTVSTAALSLLALTTSGVGAALASVLGAGGLGLITKEVSDYLKEKADLREMPFYMLWRLGKAQSK